MTDLLILSGLLIYLLGALRTYRWIRSKQKNEMYHKAMGAPPWWGVAIGCLLWWYGVEAVLLYVKWDDALEEKFNQKYAICPECKGKPLIINYRAVWNSTKPPFKCPRCKGTGIIRKDKQA